MADRSISGVGLLVMRIGEGSDEFLEDAFCIHRSASGSQQELLVDSRKRQTRSHSSLTALNWELISCKRMRHGVDYCGCVKVMTSSARSSRSSFPA